jgi:tetratricopeptide (TPR) repeat protein
MNPSSHPAFSARVARAWTPAASCALLALFVVVVYWPGLGGGFVFDDYPNLVDNAALHVNNWDLYAWLAAVFSSEAGLGHRPLAMATFTLNHVFTGLDPKAMKLTNIAIHAVNACLVLGLLSTLLGLAVPRICERRREWTARFAAAAWALHPINLMAVLFIVQRMESLCHTFVFAGLWLYLLGRQRQLSGHPGGGWRLVGGIVGGTALGLLCKESAALLPLYAALLELCLLGARDTSGRRDPRLLWLFAIVLLLPALLGLAWLLPKALAPNAYASRDFSLGERLLTEGRVVLDYLRWTTFPSLRAFALHHDDIVVSRSFWQPPATVFALIALASLAAAGMFVRRRRPLVALGIAWFLGAQLLTATVLPLELVFEHRNYFASLGVCIAVADLLLLAPRHEGARRIGVLLGLLWLLFLSMTTFLRANEWSNPLRFASTEAAKNPQSPRAAYEYGRTLVIVSDYRPDSPLLPLAMKELERDRALRRSGILPHCALLLTAAHTGLTQRPEWWKDIAVRLRRDPVGVQEISAIGSLAQCARGGACSFPHDAMVATFQAALSHGPNPEVLNIYADYVFNVLRQPDTALQLWRQAIRLQPNEAQYRINLIRALIALGRVGEARNEIAGLRRLGGPLATTEQAVRDLEERLLPPGST